MPASCKGPGLRQSHGTTCEGRVVGAVIVNDRRGRSSWRSGLACLGGVGDDGFLSVAVAFAVDDELERGGGEPIDG